MEIDKQAKALLNGEVVEFKYISPIHILSMSADINTEPIVYQNKLIHQATKPTYRIEAELETCDEFDMRSGKKYYLVEVFNEKN